MFFGQTEQTNQTELNSTYPAFQTIPLMEILSGTQLERERESL